MEAQSIPHMFFTRAAARGDKPAQRVKVNGAWRDTSWRELHDAVRQTAQGLIDLGVAPGDRVAILSDSRAEWVQCDLATQATGAITIPVYPSLLEEQAAYILQNSETSLIFVDTPAQLAKIKNIRDQVPSLRHIISMHEADTDADVLSLSALAKRGAAADAVAQLDERVAQITPDHEATYVYTSGTTGPPKGVVQTHGNHLSSLSMLEAALETQEGEVHLLFLPLAHSFARLESFIGIYLGLTTAFAESIDALPDNMQDIKPMFMFSGLSVVSEKMDIRFARHLYP